MLRSLPVLLGQNWGISGCPSPHSTAEPLVPIQAARVSLSADQQQQQVRPGSTRHSVAAPFRPAPTRPLPARCRASRACRRRTRVAYGLPHVHERLPGRTIHAPGWRVSHGADALFVSKFQHPSPLSLICARSCPPAPANPCALSAALSGCFHSVLQLIDLHRRPELEGPAEHLVTHGVRG